jgi:hypothetical protein
MNNKTITILGAMAIIGGYLYFSNKKKKQEEEAKKIAEKIKEEVKVEVKENASQTPTKPTNTPLGLPPLVSTKPIIDTSRPTPPRELGGVPRLVMNKPPLVKSPTDVLASVPRPMGQPKLSQEEIRQLLASSNSLAMPKPFRDSGIIPKKANPLVGMATKMSGSMDSLV